MAETAHQSSGPSFWGISLKLHLVDIDETCNIIGETSLGLNKFDGLFGLQSWCTYSLEDKDVERYTVPVGMSCDQSIFADHQTGSHRVFRVFTHVTSSSYPVETTRSYFKFQLNFQGTWDVLPRILVAEQWIKPDVLLLLETSGWLVSKCVGQHPTTFAKEIPSCGHSAFPNRQWPAHFSLSCITDLRFTITNYSLLRLCIIYLGAYVSEWGMCPQAVAKKREDYY